MLLSIRAEDVAADDEFAAMLNRTGLREAQLRRIRMERRPLGDIDLDDFSGVILGGGPFQASDPEESKSPVQRRVETELAALLDEVVRRDYPFLGCCYGIGTLGRHQGGTIDRTYGEPIGGIRITLTEHGRRDPLFRTAGTTFGASWGTRRPSARCRVTPQRWPRHRLVRCRPSRRDPRLRHPVPSRTRPRRPRHQDRGPRYAGYFPPEEADAVLAAARASGVAETPNLLARFVELFARD